MIVVVKSYKIGGTPIVSQDSLLVTLVKLVDRVPMPTLPLKRKRGHRQPCTPIDCS
jgi:hypothetical protein